MAKPRPETNGKPPTLTGQVTKRSVGIARCLETESPEGAVREAKRPVRPIARGKVEGRTGRKPTRARESEPS